MINNNRYIADYCNVISTMSVPCGNVLACKKFFDFNTTVLYFLQIVGRDTNVYLARPYYLGHGLAIAVDEIVQWYTSQSHSAEAVT